GASTEAIHRERVQTLGEDAAAGLAALDEERARWQSRLTDYARARDAIRRSGMGDADQLAAIQALIQQRFEGPERLRVQALDATL
ncbi:MAG: lipase chaperone, partial [Gammaproteobacteria bacterium]|nr:lipase chaperone [Gammaproteobacteria bacterium]